MLKKQIKVGSHYIAKISGKLTTCRVDAIRETSRGTRNTITSFDVTNLATRRRTTFHSAQKFRSEVTQAQAKAIAKHGEEAKCLNDAPLEAGEAAEMARPVSDSELAELVKPEATADRLRLEERAVNPPQQPARPATRGGETLPIATPSSSVGSTWNPTLETQVKTDLTPGVSVRLAAPRGLPKLDEENGHTDFTPPTVDSPLASLLRKSLAKTQGTETGPPHLIVEARAGTGKTFSLVVGIVWTFKDRVPGLWDLLIKKLGFDPVPSVQQQAVWEQMSLSADAKTVKFVAFNKSIVSEFERTWGWVIKALAAAGIALEFSTMHSMGFKAVQKAFGRQEPNSFAVQDIISELLETDIRELRRTKPVVLKATEELVSLCKMNLTGFGDFKWSTNDHDWNTELSQLASHYDVDTNHSRAEVFALVPRVLERCKEPRGKISFDDMIWLPVVLSLPLFRYDLLLVDEAQDLNRCQQALAKRAGKRLILCGDPKQCLLPGTLVSLEGGKRVPVEELVDWGEGSRVMTFNPSGGRIAGRRSQGRIIEATHAEDYDGEIVEIRAGENTVSCTLSHRWWVRFAPDCKDRFCLYLMEKQGQFRVGICQMQYACGMGVSARSRSEDADRAWILQVFDTVLEARIAEELVAVDNGLPQLVFLNRGATSPDQEFIDAVYSWLGDNRDRAEKCLREFGREVQHPIWEKRGEGRYNYLSVTKGFVVHSSNLIDGCFQLRVDDDTTTGRWETASVGRKEYAGKVFGLTVEPTERGLRLYLANNIVSHNSIYGFAGADAESMPRMAKELGVVTCGNCGANINGCWDRTAGGKFGGCPKCHSFNTVIPEGAGVVILPLTVTRRCGRAIVKEANRYVKDFEAHESNPDGKISEARYPVRKRADGGKEEVPWEQTYMALAKPGDMVLCRVNAPLVSNCFRFLKRGIKATIQGRDVGAGLVSTVKKSKASTVEQLVAWLSDWLHKETAKENAKRCPNEARLIALGDRYDCLVCFTDGANTVEDVVKKIESVFTDDKTCPGIRLSSVHKAKGLESRRVFILQPEGAAMPHPMAKSAWQIAQEYNILYVAITRAIEELVWVS